jgi:exonuclease III
MKKRPVTHFLFVLTPLILGGITIATSHLERGKWWMELLSFGMPVVLVATLLVLIAWMILRPGLRYLWLPLLALVAAIEPLNATFAINLPKERSGHDLSVMSFNAALFNPYRPSTLESDTTVYSSIYSYLRENPPPDILCIQEFFHSTRDEQEMSADSIQQLGGYSHFYINPVHNTDYEGLIGVITFSKFPMAGNGKLEFGDDRFNNGHWSDVVIGSDTLRIFAVQMQSMSIRWRSVEGSSWFNNLRLNLANIYRKLKWGYRIRTAEMERIEEALDASPHRVIVCADLNALPYSHTYQRLKSRYHNAFEKGGMGFGFTYHHFPWFIRIDNQFYDHDLEIQYFRTLNGIRVSDHYPIVAGYKIGNATNHSGRQNR